jgi:hypothetical protein
MGILSGKVGLSNKGWYLFNEAGVLTESVDYDVRYIFTLWEVVRWAMKEGMPFADIAINKFNLRHRSPQWIVQHDRGDRRDQYVLDGVSGEVLEMHDLENYQAYEP